MIARAMAGAAVLAALAGTAVPAGAEPALVGATAAAVGTPRAAWLLDEPGNPETAYDSSGFGNDGTNHDIVGTGTGYEFNGSTSRVVVADSPSLNPGTADFSFGVTIAMTKPPNSGDTYDVLRKGIASTRGGTYKLEIKNVNGTARARCLAKDSARVVGAIVAPTSLADGAPHTITCTKTGAGVTIQIDALAPRTKWVSNLGSVWNTSQLALGAKAESTAKTGFDWYDGRIDDAWVQIS